MNFNFLEFKRPFQLTSVLSPFTEVINIEPNLCLCETTSNENTSKFIFKKEKQHLTSLKYYPAMLAYCNLVFLALMSVPMNYCYYLAYLWLLLLIQFSRSKTYVLNRFSFLFNQSKFLLSSCYQTWAYQNPHLLMLMVHGMLRAFLITLSFLS